MLGAIGVGGKIAYHLFGIDSSSEVRDAIKLCRKTQWHFQNKTSESKFTTFLSPPSGKQARNFSKSCMNWLANESNFLFFSFFLSLTLENLCFLRISLDNYISGLDFHPNGEIIATINRYSVCVISNVNTNEYCFHYSMGMDNGQGNVS